MRPRQVEALDLALHVMRKIGFDRIARQTRANDRPVFGLARDDADIRAIALVAGARDRERDQRRLDATAGRQGHFGHSRVDDDILVIGRRQERREGDVRAVDLHRDFHEGLVDQEGEQPHHRRSRGTAGVDATAAGRGRERCADAFLRQQFAGFRTRVLHGEAQYDFARRAAARIGAATVKGLVADHVDRDIAERREARFLQHLADAIKHGFGHAARLGRRIVARENRRGDEAEAAGIGGRNLVGARRHAALRAIHAHAIRAILHHGHARKIADDVGQDVGGGIADLVEHLFGDGERRDRAARARRFRDDEGAVGKTFGDRPANVFPA